MEYLLYFPMGTGWELAFFVGLMAAWFVSDYVCNSKPKRSKRTERQIFDGHLEVSEMIFDAVVIGEFESLDVDSRRGILSFVYQRYK